MSWDDAFAEIDRRLGPMLEEHGRDAVAVYLGNPNAHNLDALLYGRAFVKALGTRNVVLGHHRRPDAQARVRGADVRHRRSASRSPTWTAPTTC